MTMRRKLVLIQTVAIAGLVVAGLPMSAQAAGTTQAGTPSPSVPPAALRAEMHKQWAVAEAIYRRILARHPDRVDLRLRLADVLAAQGKSAEAAKALALAADQRPRDAALQAKASEAFAAAKDARNALVYIDRALSLRPDDMSLERRRLALANWAGNDEQALDSVRILMGKTPGDASLQREYALILSRTGHLDKAASLLSDYVATHPADRSAVMDLARIQAWRGNLAVARTLLERYRRAGGNKKKYQNELAEIDGSGGRPETMSAPEDSLIRQDEADFGEVDYQRELALIEGWSGRPAATLALADSLIRRDGADFRAHYARAIALRDNYEYAAAMREIDILEKLRPGSPEVAELRRTITAQQKPYLQIDTAAIWSSDSIFSTDGGVSYHQPITDSWWVMAGGGANYLRASRETGYGNLDGGNDAADGGGWIGAKTRVAPGALAEARIGAASNGQGHDALIWRASLTGRLSDDLHVQISNSRDFEGISPRSVSLGITRIDTQLTAVYTPDFDWTVGAIARESELSDHNHYGSFYLAPRRSVLRSQYFNVDLGVSGDWSGYSRTPNDGYYSPKFLQKYAVDTYLYYKINYESGVSLIVSPGVLRDNTMHTFRFGTGVAAEATFGQYSDWMTKIRAAYSDNGTDYGNRYSAESVGITLVRRF